MLWESTRPNNLDDVHTNLSLVNSLSGLSAKIKLGASFQNLIICGPPQSGKLTITRAFLSSVFDNDIYNLETIEHSVRQNCSNYTVKIYRSIHHFEVSFTGLQYADRCVLTSLLDNYFSTANVVNREHKILVIRNFEELTRPAQFSLRRRIETAFQSVRFIFISRSFNHIEPAIISRCLLLKCPKPNNIEIENRLKYICRDRKDCRGEMIDKAIELSGKNVGKAFLNLSAMIECNSTDIIDPVEHALKPLMIILKGKEYDCVSVRKILSDLQLAHIQHTRIIWYLIDNVENLLKTPSQIYDVVIYAAKCETIAAKGKRSVIALEKLILHLYQLINQHL